MEQELEGKKILLFFPEFFDYGKTICNKMQEMGAEVDYYDERAITSTLSKAFLKVSPSIFNKQSNKYFEQILNEVKENNYDYILIVKCDMISEYVLSRMRKQFQHSTFILYLFDSLKNIKYIEKKIRYFDKAYSFDRFDCLKNSALTFRPLYFSDDFKQCEIQEENTYDVCFIGTIHSDRFKIIKNLIEQSEKLGFTFYTFNYLQSKSIFLLYKIFKPEFWRANKKMFSFHKMNMSEISNIVKHSKIILDIQHPNQVGLTQRTIEMIGMNKKIITTNPDIRNYDFYDENNILVIDRDHPTFEKNFFNTEYMPIKNEIYERYYLRNWILEVLQLNRKGTNL